MTSISLVRAGDDSHSSELVHRLEKETQEEQGGWKSVSLGIVNALLINAPRTGGTCSSQSHPQSNKGGNGWSLCMAGAEIGAALNFVHERPEHRWTIAELGHELSVSGSAFAARYKAITGRPPQEFDRVAITTSRRATSQS